MVWRGISITFFLNCGKSSRKNTLLWARMISLGEYLSRTHRRFLGKSIVSTTLRSLTDSPTVFRPVPNPRSAFTMVRVSVIGFIPVENVPLVRHVASRPDVLTAKRALFLSFWHNRAMEKLPQTCHLMCQRCEGSGVAGIGQYIRCENHGIHTHPR